MLFFASVVMFAIQVMDPVKANIAGVFIWNDYPIVIGKCVDYLHQDTFWSYKFDNCVDQSETNPAVTQYIYHNLGCDDNDLSQTELHSSTSNKVMDCPSGGYNDATYGSVYVHISYDEDNDDTNCPDEKPYVDGSLQEMGMYLATSYCFTDPTSQPSSPYYQAIFCNSASDSIETYYYSDSGCVYDTSDEIIDNGDCSPTLDGDTDTGLIVDECLDPYFP
eukprot:227860_1